jgi:cation-transporting ATPase F
MRAAKARMWANTANDGRIVGDPTEGALLVVARKAGLDETNSAEELFPRLDEIPFDSARQYMATAARRSRASGSAVLTRARLEQLLPRSQRMLDANGQSVARYATRRSRTPPALWPAQGLRVLAVARLANTPTDGALTLDEHGADAGLVSSSAWSA